MLGEVRALVEVVPARRRVGVIDRRRPVVAVVADRPGDWLLPIRPGERVPQVVDLRRVVADVVLELAVLEDLLSAAGRVGRAVASDAAHARLAVSSLRSGRTRRAPKRRGAAVGEDGGEAEPRVVGELGLSRRKIAVGDREDLPVGAVASS